MSIQLTTVEGEQRKKFTARQRLEILREWDSSGNGVEVSRRYGIRPMTLYRWHGSVKVLFSSGTFLR